MKAEPQWHKDESVPAGHKPGGRWFKSGGRDHNRKLYKPDRNFKICLSFTRLVVNYW